MDQLAFYAMIALSGLAAVAVVAHATLRGWSAWIDLKRAELHHSQIAVAPSSAGSRIEIADLKERIRKLEAIAAGVEL